VEGEPTDRRAAQERSLRFLPAGLRFVGATWAGFFGARSQGTNRMGWRVWSTTCTVTAAEPGRRFEFDVTFGPLAIATWSYELIGAGGDTIVREAWRERRRGWFRTVTGRVMGVADRVEHNRAGMQATLQALRSAAEART
jgi:hypothetical protein